MRRNLPLHLISLGVPNVSVETIERGLEGVKTKDLLNRVFEDGTEYSLADSEHEIPRTRGPMLVRYLNGLINKSIDLQKENKYAEAAKIRRDALAVSGPSTPPHPPASSIDRRE